MRTLRKPTRGWWTAAALLLTAIVHLGCASEITAAASIGNATSKETAGAESAAEVLPGVEVLVRDHAEELRGKRVGILTNQTGVDREFRSTIDLVRALPGVEVVRLFSPEHGIRGGIPAGEQVDSSVDPVSGLPVVSLYGASRRPKAEDLRDLDVVLYDIQDVGSRSYTYVSTLTYLMEAVEELGVEVWVLDRPEPMGGHIVGGPMLDDDLKSFIGVHNVPQVYGMTPGEWARMIRTERTPGVALRVVPVEGWRRGMNYGEVGWAWVPPSPHIPRWESSYFYAMTGIIGELGRVSEGVGTPLPFELMGAPWLDGRALEREFNAAGLAGVRARAVSFIPRYGTHAGEECSGIQIHLDEENLRAVDPARVSFTLMRLLNRLAPERGVFAEAEKTLFLKALGDRELGEALAEGEDVGEFEPELARELAEFLKRRAEYLIYE